MIGIVVRVLNNSAGSLCRSNGGRGGHNAGASEDLRFASGQFHSSRLKRRPRSFSDRGGFGATS
jgi:hypothetical protein